MSSPAETYVKGVHRKFDLYAAWPPGQPRALGDVGRLRNGAFELLTTLKNLDIPFTERVGPRGEDISYTSGSSVSVELKAQGQTIPGVGIPQAKAGALVQFSSAGAFVLQVAGPVMRQIEDQVSLAEHVLGLFRKKKNGKRQWQEDWFIITELLTADRVTVLLSNSSSSKVELSAEGVIPAGSAPLANAGGGLSIVTQKGEVTSVLSVSNLTPMFRLSRVRRSVLDRIWGGDDSADLGRALVRPAGAAMPQRVFEPVPVKDALGGPTRAWEPAKPKRPSKPSKGTKKPEKPPAKTTKKTATRKKAAPAKPVTKKKLRRS